MIESSAERLFGGNVDAAMHAAVAGGEWPARLWTLAVDSGFACALARDEHGGTGANWADAWPILRALGYWQVPLPLAETMIATMLLSMAGVAPPEGAITLVEEAGAGGLALDGPAQQPALRGRASRVSWARHCRWALVSMRAPHAGTLLLVDLQQGGSVRTAAGANLADEPSDEVAFDGARCSARVDNPLPGLDEPLRHLGALTRSAMIAGALDSTLAQSVGYANQRIQFGRPIGRFQAIQHALAVLAAEAAAARMAAIVAAGSAPSIATGDGASAAFDIAVAKLRCSEAATRAAPIAHQVHGAIGFTREHPLHRATCRLWAWRAEYGSDTQWAERLGSAAISAGPEGFWPAVTQRGFDGA
ncbi:MAG: acyl-CoA dehydrogenase [Burkholderiales bacterium]|nr:MAG: acyl-CoA dehydrogenase [Burkholderiales bacterium]